MSFIVSWGMGNREWGIGVKEHGGETWPPRAGAGRRGEGEVAGR